MNATNATYNDAAKLDIQYWKRNALGIFEKVGSLF